jgi:hypothetical protein
MLVVLIKPSGMERDDGGSHSTIRSFGSKGIIRNYNTRSRPSFIKVEWSKNVKGKATTGWYHAYRFQSIEEHEEVEDNTNRKVCVACQTATVINLRGGWANEQSNICPRCNF